MTKTGTFQTGLGRRDFIRIVALAGAAGALWHFSPSSRPGSSVTVRRSRAMMGTQINLIVHGPDPDRCEMAVNATLDRMELLSGLLSRHDPRSDLSRLNAGGILRRPGHDLQAVLLQAAGISRLTDGAFDVTILPLHRLYAESSGRGSLPREEQLSRILSLVDYRRVSVSPACIEFAEQGMSITLDGIAKGYIVDQGATVLREMGFNNVYVEAGGDLLAAGSRPGGKPWRIGIRNPRPEMRKDMKVIELTDRAVATSGDYMQPFSADRLHHHIIDPRSGHSPAALASATVIAPTVVLADALATAAMVMGPEKSMDLIASLPGCEGYFIAKDLREFSTPGFFG
ncbi:MAG: FAD:protein FMN transferase [Desulfobulbaceae bacterium]